MITRMSLENTFYPAELFHNLIDYLDCNSVNNLLQSSSQLYNRYAYDEYTIKKIMTQIFKELRINLTIHENFSNFQYREKRLYFHDLISIHSYFINFHSFGLNNIVCFLVSRNKTYKTSNILFEQLLIEINTHFSNPRYRNINGLDFGQISEIISNCDNNQLVIIFQQMVIPKNIICTSIKTMLNSKIMDLSKIKQCIQYFLIKSTFGNRNKNYSTSYFLTDILSEIIITNNTIIMEYILRKRSYTRTYFDYSFLVLKCLEYDRIDMLKIIHESNPNIFSSNKKPIFITGNMISDIVKRGSFLTLKWIVENLLGTMINLNVYIMSITSSIAMCKKIENLNYLFYLENYLTVTSKHNINDSLNFLYYKHKTPFYNKIFYNIAINN